MLFSTQLLKIERTSGTHHVIDVPKLSIVLHLQFVSVPCLLAYFKLCRPLCTSTLFGIDVALVAAAGRRFERSKILALAVNMKRLDNAVIFDALGDCLSWAPVYNISELCICPSKNLRQVFVTDKRDLYMITSEVVFQ